MINIISDVPRRPLLLSSTLHCLVTLARKSAKYVPKPSLRAARDIKEAAPLLESLDHNEICRGHRSKRMSATSYPHAAYRSSLKGIYNIHKVIQKVGQIFIYVCDECTTSLGAAPSQEDIDYIYDNTLAGHRLRQWAIHTMVELIFSVALSGNLRSKILNDL